MQGLDPRYAGTHAGALFGAGVYLASNSSKSDLYTEPNYDRKAQNTHPHIKTVGFVGGFHSIFDPRGVGGGRG